MTEIELYKIDVAERICNILARKPKPTAEAASEEMGMPIDMVNNIIKENDLYYRAIWLKFDNEIEKIEIAQKKLNQRAADAEYTLNKNLENLLKKACE